MNRFINSKYKILAALLVGLVLRLISLNQSLWLDEATSALAAKMPLSDFFTKFMPGDFHPPLYYLILKLWASIFGFSEISLRIPSVIFGLGMVYFVYLIAKKLFNEKTGIIAATLIATSGLAVYYSQEARMYSLAAFLVGVLVYMFIQKKWVLFSITLALLAMTDYVSLFILPVFWILGKKDFKKLVLAHIPAFAVFLIWLPVFYKQILGGLSVQGSNWWNLLGVPTIKNAALILVKFILGRISFDNKIIYGAITAAVILLFGFVIYKARRSSKLIWLWLSLSIFLGILISFKVPTLSYFRFLFCLPAFYILLAVGIEKAGRYKYLFLSALIAVNLISTMYYLTNYKFQREDWRAAARAIGSDTIVFPVASQTEALEYYGKGSQIVFAGSFAGSEKEIWLSRYVWQIFDPTDSARKKVENLGYNMRGQYNFNGVVFYKYSK
jgi:uncharacterized membrane protein